MVVLPNATAYDRDLKRPEGRAPFDAMEQPAPKQVLHAPPKNFSLLELIRAKRERSWKPSFEELRRGFRGWHQRGYLPHFDAPSVTQAVTFVLADSFPTKRRAEWESIPNQCEESVQRKKLQGWLDRGHGECWNGRPDVARIVEEVLREAHTREYQIRAWVIMSNHIHVILDVWDVPLATLVGKWKGKSAHLANALLRRRGKFWQEDYFDTLIRNAEHLKRAIRYTEQNPVKAFLVKSAHDWQWSSARHRDVYGRLRLPEGED
jgi:putative transposase